MDITNDPPGRPTHTEANKPELSPCTKFKLEMKYTQKNIFFHTWIRDIQVIRKVLPIVHMT